MQGMAGRLVVDVLRQVSAAHQAAWQLHIWGGRLVIRGHAGVDKQASAESHMLLLHLTSTGADRAVAGHLLPGGLCADAAGPDHGGGEGEREERGGGRRTLAWLERHSAWGKLARCRKGVQN